MSPLIELVESDLLLRIGLRYGDLIKIGNGETLEDYVDPYFGYPKVVQPLGQLSHQRDEVVIKTEVGRLMIRSLYGYHNLVHSPDLQGIPGCRRPTRIRVSALSSTLTMFGQLPTKQSRSSLDVQKTS